jgi:hypothetical protein
MYLYYMVHHQQQDIIMYIICLLIYKMMYYFSIIQISNIRHLQQQQYNLIMHLLTFHKY